VRFNSFINSSHQRMKRQANKNLTPRLFAARRNGAKCCSGCLKFSGPFSPFPLPALTEPAVLRMPRTHDWSLRPWECRTYDHFACRGDGLGPILEMRHDTSYVPIDEHLEREAPV
jgi:hypothetical protein